jgi:osmotically-inducible protein OsmY
MAGPSLLEAVRRRLAGEPRIGTAGHALALSLDGTTLTMEGEVGDLAAKKLALERAASVPGVEHIVDRVRVVPACAMGDAEIRDHLRDALSGEPEFQPVVAAVPRPAPGPLAPETTLGRIGISVHAGVVTLDGSVPSLAHRRLAGVLAWWIPGVRDVVNGLEVAPDEEDGDDEITDAVRLALEMDPLVDAGEVAVSTRQAVVELRGVVRSDVQRRAAERDAWCVLGVNDVRSELLVRPA